MHTRLSATLGVSLIIFYGFMVEAKIITPFGVVVPKVGRVNTFEVITVNEWRQ